MKRIFRSGLGVFVIAMGISLAAPRVFAEHPGSGSEHPGSGMEHPAERSKASSQSEKKSVTKKDLAQFIGNYVRQKSKKEGYFLVKDEKTGKELKLKLDKVHEDRLACVKKDLYFVCADFTAGKDKTYDLDFWIEGKDRQSLKVKEITVHKEDGKERYTWKEEDGLWKKVSLKTGKAAGASENEEHSHEHPGSGSEHPGGGSEHPHD